MTGQTEPTDSWSWMEILREHPEFADKCQCWNDFSDYDRLWLEECQSQLVDKYRRKAND